MQISDKNLRPAAEVAAGFVIEDTVLLAGVDTVPTRHRFAVLDAETEADGSVQLTVLADRGSDSLTLGYGSDERVRVLRAPFKPGYAVNESRIFRARLRVDRGTGVATVAFKGQVVDATDCTVQASTSGSRGISLFAEVVPDETSLTTVKVAVVPTGKRTPAQPSRWLGSVGGSHVYLLEVDGSADRAGYERAAEAREAARAAKRMLLAAGSGCDYDDCEDDD